MQTNDSRVARVDREDGVAPPHILPHASHCGFAPPCGILQGSAKSIKLPEGRRAQAPPPTWAQKIHQKDATTNHHHSNRNDAINNSHKNMNLPRNYHHYCDTTNQHTNIQISITIPNKLELVDAGAATPGPPPPPLPPPRPIANQHTSTMAQICLVGAGAVI